jgi:hypothetical protein
VILKSVNITREGDYGYGSVDPSKPFRATIAVSGTHGKVELLLSTELSRRIVEIVADEVANAGRATAEMMTAEAINGTALPAPETAHAAQ